jgi:uncharacterized membrane protein
MGKLKFASKIYETGVYLSLFLIVISLIASAFPSRTIKYKLISFNLHDLFNGIVNFEPTMLLYLSSCVLVISPIVVIIYLMVYYFVKKKYYDFIISLFLIIMITCVLIFKTA